MANDLEGVGELAEFVERAVMQHDVPALRKIRSYARAMTQAGEALEQLVVFAERGAPSGMRERDQARYQRRVDALARAVADVAAAKAACEQAG